MSENALQEKLDRIEAEPLVTGEPAESVQLGRWQVVDEIRQLLKSGEVVVVDGERLEESVRQASLAGECPSTATEEECQRIGERCDACWRAYLRGDDGE